MTTYNLIDVASPGSMLEDIDVSEMGTNDLEWLRRSAEKAGHTGDVATLTDELERRVTP